MRRSGQNLRFLANKSPYLSNGARWPRLLLITNRKSYTGSRLPQNSMILDDLERQNRVFNRFFCRFLPATQVYIIHKVAPRNYRFAIQIENLVNLA